MTDMRRLVLLRHFKSDRSASGVADHDRPLNTRGHEQGPLIAAYLVHNALVPDRVLCSTAARARATWDLVTRHLPKPPLVALEERLYEAEPETILDLVRETSQKAHSLLVVGHNPGLQQAALMLIASGDVEMRERLREKFPTGALAVIDFALDEWRKVHPHAGRLDRLVTPRMLSEEPD